MGSCASANSCKVNLAAPVAKLSASTKSSDQENFSSAFGSPAHKVAKSMKACRSISKVSERSMVTARPISDFGQNTRKVVSRASPQVARKFAQSVQLNHRSAPLSVEAIDSVQSIPQREELVKFTYVFTYGDIEYKVPALGEVASSSILQRRELQLTN